MSEKSARALLGAAAGASICIRYVVDRAGRVVFDDRRSTAQRRAMLVLASMALAVTSAAGCARFEPSSEAPPEPKIHPVFVAGSGDVGVVVLDRWTDQPLTDIPIQLRAWPNHWAHVTDGEGKAEFEHLEPGTYEIQIVAGLAEATEWVDLMPGIRVEVTFRIDPAVASRYEGRPPDYYDTEPIVGIFDPPSIPEPEPEPERTRRRRR